MPRFLSLSILASCWKFCTTRSLEAAVDGLRLDQSAKVVESVDADSRFVFHYQTITDLRNQHPFGNGDLRSTGELDNQNRRCAFP
jgi:hypothetical protein